ncbi:MAG: two-component sensor histidine kinase [Enterovirga sp.]|nr:two-component sensor histidine kinase [Enterovirga sp.]
MAPGTWFVTLQGSYLPKLFRATAFKLSFYYLVTFAIFAFLALGYVAWNATKVLNDQIVDTIEAEIAGLADQYRTAGIRRLVAIVDRRARQPGASLYLVTNFAGERIAGNVGSLPPGTLNEAGQREVDYGRAEDEARDHRAIVRVFLLPGGFRLLVGRDVEERARIREIIGRAFGVSLLLVGVLGCLGAWFVTKRVLKRVDDMTGTTERIMAGDLSGRVQIAGTGDELDRLAQNLNAMLDRIGELMVGLTEVSNNIAHDLKTPLTRLRNRADEALRVASSPDQLRTALEGVIEESDGLIRIFNALLMIARLEAGHQNTGMADFDVSEVARGIAELYEPLAEEAGIGLDVAVEPGLIITGSRELMGQAVANLIDNAIKYGSKAASSGDAQPVLVRALREGDAVTVTVADRGPGIPAEDRDRVLGRFVRLEAARSRPGFGLGLSLAAAVSRIHGGTLTLSDNGPGLRVTLSFPASAAAAA